MLHRRPFRSDNRALPLERGVYLPCSAVAVVYVCCCCYVYGVRETSELELHVLAFCTSVRLFFFVLRRHATPVSRFTPMVLSNQHRAETKTMSQIAINTCGEGRPAFRRRWPWPGARNNLLRRRRHGSRTASAFFAKCSTTHSFVPRNTVHSAALPHTVCSRSGHGEAVGSR